MTAPYSVVVPLIERFEDIPASLEAYEKVLSGYKADREYIVVITPAAQHMKKKLDSYFDKLPNLKIIELSRAFGEATILQMAAEAAEHELLLILPPYQQVDPKGLLNIFNHIEDCDMVITKRWPRADKAINRWQTRAFNSAISKLSGTSYSDLGCNVRLLKKSIFENISVYGDQHRFLPIIANSQGFQVVEIAIEQAAEDAAFKHVYSPGTYVRRGLDLLSIVFLSKFNKKPLRFFGLIGASSFFVGLVLFLMVAVERIFFDVAAGDRPMLLVSVLFIVLGIQLAAIGLVGETVIFTHSSDIKEYKIKKIHSAPTTTSPD